MEVTGVQARTAVFEGIPYAKPLRLEVREDNEPMITAGSALFQPFAIVHIPMVEPTERLPLRSAVNAILIVNGYRPAPK